jgi:hypothetical protein
MTEVSHANVTIVNRAKYVTPIMAGIKIIAAKAHVVSG